MFLGVLDRDRLRGTVGYMSPELILTGHSSKATDVFAAGVVLYILLCGHPPFQSKSNREILEKTAKGAYKMVCPSSLIIILHSVIEWIKLFQRKKHLLSFRLINSFEWTNSHVFWF